MAKDTFFPSFHGPITPLCLDILGCAAEINGMAQRTQKTHVIIIDGTASRLHPEQETNAGLLYKLLKSTIDKKQTSLWYDPGIQARHMLDWITVASGLGINQSIQRAYGHLATRYRAGDRVFLFGYSRGAYAVRSLAGWINRLGLIRRSEATPSRIRQAFRLYEHQRPEHEMMAFCDAHCTPDIEIEMIGVWDTVKALGLPYPVLSRLAPMATEFHNDRVGHEVRHAFHALALDETRTAYRPILWDLEPNWAGHIEQAWFRGSHADVGGHVWRRPEARGLSNIPLVWMLSRAERCGLILPENWQDRYPQDANAPAVGSYRGAGRFFLLRKRREIGLYPGEAVHNSVAAHQYENAQQLPRIA